MAILFQPKWLRSKLLRRISFPKKSLKIGEKRLAKWRHLTNIKRSATVELINYKSYWWLHYKDESGATGSFSSKKSAIEYFERGGR